ncbi:MAG: MerR family transcriptional regulator [Stellaceae bacterium]
MKATDVLSIGALSKRAGVNIETIRYYERIGVMPAPDRSPGGYRLYDATDLKRLAFVRRCRELGFSLGEIRELLRVVDGHEYTCAEIHTLVLDHLAEIRQKIADLRRLQKVMDDMAAQCSRNRIPECPIVDAFLREEERSS